MRKACITGLGSYSPRTVLTNQDLEKRVDTTSEWIKTRTGVETRRIASEEETTLVLAHEASKEAMRRAGVRAENLDLIIVATVTPDMVFPATACLLQDALGASRAAAFDLEAGCSGFVYGLIVAAQFIETGAYETVLVVGSETLSRITDWEDRNTCVLFGDGAGACILQASPASDEGLLAYEMGSDGSGGAFLQLPAGGSKMPASAQTVENRLHYIQMDGNQVFKFAVKAMARSARKSIEKAGLSLEDIDLYIPHQANIRIIESSAKRLKIPMDKVFVNLESYGNTSSASIPIALREALDQNYIQSGSISVFVGFGAGLSWGSCVIRWPRDKDRLKSI